MRNGIRCMEKYSYLKITHFRRKLNRIYNHYKLKISLTIERKQRRIGNGLAVRKNTLRKLY